MAPPPVLNDSVAAG